MIQRAYWWSLRWFLATWLLLAVLGFALLGFNLFCHAEIIGELTRLKQQLQATRDKVTLNSSYQPYIVFFRSHHSRWQQQGLNRPADPQQWAAAWPGLQQQWQLPHMQYDIQPAINCEAAACDAYWPGKPVTGLALTVTPLKVRWSVSHETEVLDWLQHLQHMYGGTLVVRGCSWALAESTDLIAAQCELQLFDFARMWPVAAEAICCD
jgi:hypothetical protein